MIGDFFGVGPDGQLLPKREVVLASGEIAALRPLSVERLLRIVSLGFVLPPIEEWESMPLMDFMTMVAQKAEPALEIALCGRKLSPTRAEVMEIIAWYAGEHDWPRIYKGIIEPKKSPEESREGLVDDLFISVEKDLPSRTYERQLAMRPEAWLSLVESRERGSESAQEAMRMAGAGSSKEATVSNIGLNTLFQLLPGGETRVIKEDPTDG